MIERPDEGRDERDPRDGTLVATVRRAMAPLERDKRPPRLPDVDGGRLTALLAHMSCFCGLPVFMVALIKRDNAFALHHAKAAACNFALFYMFLLLSLVLHPLFFIPMLACYIPDLVAIGRAVRGDEAGHMGFGSLGEFLFTDLRVQGAPRRAPRQVEREPEPPQLTDGQVDQRSAPWQKPS